MLGKNDDASIRGALCGLRTSYYQQYIMSRNRTAQTATDAQGGVIANLVCWRLCVAQSQHTIFGMLAVVRSTESTHNLYAPCGGKTFRNKY